MAVHQISYDLHRTEQDYAGLYDGIKALGDHRHPLQSMWWVATPLTASQVSDRIMPYLDRGDRLFISRVNVDRQGWLCRADWEWLNGRQAA